MRIVTLALLITGCSSAQLETTSDSGVAMADLKPNADGLTDGLTDARSPRRDGARQPEGDFAGAFADGAIPDTVSPQDGARGDGNASDSSGELDGQSALPPAWSASCGQRGGFQVTTLSSMMGSPTLASNESDSHVLFMLGSYLGLFHWHQDATGAVTTHTNKLGVNVGLNPFATLDQSGLLHASAFNNDGLIYLHRAANGTWSHELLHRATLYKSSSAIAVDQSGEVVILMPERRAPFRILMFSKKAGSASWKHQTFASSDSPAFVALATSATRDTVYASYRKLDSAAKTQSVHFAIRDTTGAFRHETVYQQHTLSATSLYDAPLAVDKRGGVHMAIGHWSFEGLPTSQPDIWDTRYRGGLRYAYRAPSGGWLTSDVEPMAQATKKGVPGPWRSEPEDWTGAVYFMSPSITVDPGLRPHISYTGVGTTELRFASQQANGGWRKHVVTKMAYVNDFLNYRDSDFHIDATGRIEMIIRDDVINPANGMPNLTFARRATACLADPKLQ
jgi:hypothetical protein